MKINLKSLILNIVVPLALGGLVGIISDYSSYGTLNQPVFAPPAILFPIVWSILYILMGISAYIISENNDQEALKTYKLQLGVNLLWSIIFFNLKLRLIAFIWLILLIVLVVKMMIEFFRTSKLASIIQLPYLIWIIFASILNISIVILN